MIFLYYWSMWSEEMEVMRLMEVANKIEFVRDSLTHSLSGTQEPREPQEVEQRGYSGVLASNEP